MSVATDLWNAVPQAEHCPIQSGLTWNFLFINTESCFFMWALPRSCHRNKLKLAFSSTSGPKPPCGCVAEINAWIKHFYFIFNEEKENYAFASNKFWPTTFSTLGVKGRRELFLNRTFLFQVLSLCLNAAYMVELTPFGESTAYTLRGVDCSHPLGSQLEFEVDSPKCDLLMLGACFCTLWDVTVVFRKRPTCCMMSYFFKSQLNTPFEEPTGMLR